jgi:hypothetical protein
MRQNIDLAQRNMEIQVHAQHKVYCIYCITIHNIFPAELFVAVLLYYPALLQIALPTRRAIKCAPVLHTQQHADSFVFVLHAQLRLFPLAA